MSDAIHYRTAYNSNAKRKQATGITSHYTCPLGVVRHRPLHGPPLSHSSRMEGRKFKSFMNADDGCRLRRRSWHQHVLVYLEMARPVLFYRLHFSDKAESEPLPHAGCIQWTLKIPISVFPPPSSPSAGVRCDTGRSVCSVVQCRLGGGKQADTLLVVQ